MYVAGCAVKQSADHSKNEFLSVTEVADWLSISRPMVYKLIQSGKLRAIKVGRRLLIRKIDVEEYIEMNKTFN